MFTQNILHGWQRWFVKFHICILQQGCQFIWNWTHLCIKWFQMFSSTQKIYFCYFYLRSWHAGGDILHTKAFTFPMPTFYAGKIDEMWYLYKLRLTFLANSILHFVTLTITKKISVCLFIPLPKHFASSRWHS